MKTIFNNSEREELIHRIKSLSENSTAKWGKMDVSRMVRHCIMWEEVTQRKRKIKKTLPGMLLGKVFLKKIIKDESPLPQSLPSIEELKVSKPVNNNLEQEKMKWISLINEYPQLSGQTLRLPFFGDVKKEQAGIVAYKHTDHHLRQFDA
jgi:Protein of unknown function (DUF1569)